MKKIFLLYILLFSFNFPRAQNVGIGQPNPAEKLDVTGNINLTGQLKTNGNAGTANQVLMKDGSNNLSWADLSEYKNMQVFDCAGIAAVANGSNCTATWTVPAGVTQIFVECQGAGGGGGNASSGAAGGYIAAKFTVSAGNSATLTIGAGGNYSGAADGIIGGFTSCAIGSFSITAAGGAGGNKADASIGPLTIGPPIGGSFFTAGFVNQYIGYYGSYGDASRLSFVQTSPTDFSKVINYASGGDAPLWPGSGSHGGYKISGATITQTSYATQYGSQPGAGGGADAAGGFYGRGGRLIIHW